MRVDGAVDGRITRSRHFVKELLDAMDYEDVRVTKVSADKGVDVVARVQFGITEITEVVQMKRTENTITRPKVDELRGALPYFKAIRGTIIGLGSFAKRFMPARPQSRLSMANGFSICA